MPPEKTWGGARKGAGRKLAAKPKLRRVLITLLPEQANWLESESQRTGQAMTLIVRQAVELYKANIRSL